eukprot:2580647-Prymnesium_polylepis.1
MPNEHHPGSLRPHDWANTDCPHGLSNAGASDFPCYGLLRSVWPMVRRKAVLERYAALRCLLARGT